MPAVDNILFGMQFKQVQTFGFEQALELLKQDRLVSRLAWTGDKTLELITRECFDEIADELDGESAAWLCPMFLTNSLESSEAWAAAHSDLIATDWFEVVT